MKNYYRFFGSFLLVAGILLLPAMAFAGSKEDTQPNFDGLQWIWALFSLIFVAFIAYWVTKLFAEKAGYTRAKYLKVAESLMLGPNRHLYLLLINGKILLIGSSEQGVTLLKEYDDPTFYEQLQQSSVDQMIGKNSFASILKPLLDNPNEVIETGVDNTKQKIYETLDRIRAWRTKDKKNDQ